MVCSFEVKCEHRSRFKDDTGGCRNQEHRSHFCSNCGRLGPWTTLTAYPGSRRDRRRRWASGRATGSPSRRDILRVAREHLATDGAAALSLRAVARDLGMVSSGIYRYVESRDELLTRLIVDSYWSLAAAVRAAHDAVRADDLDGRWDALGRGAARLGDRAPARLRPHLRLARPGLRGPGRAHRGAGHGRARPARRPARRRPARRPARRPRAPRPRPERTPRPASAPCSSRPMFAATDLDAVTLTQGMRRLDPAARRRDERGLRPARARSPTARRSSTCLLAASRRCVIAPAGDVADPADPAHGPGRTAYVHIHPQVRPHLCAQRDLLVTIGRQTRRTMPRELSTALWTTLWKSDAVVRAQVTSHQPVANRTYADSSSTRLCGQRVDDGREPADNSRPACADDVHGRAASTAPAAVGASGAHTARTPRSRDADQPRRELSTASTAPMTMTRPPSQEVSPDNEGHRRPTAAVRPAGKVGVHSAAPAIRGVSVVPVTGRH